MKENAKVCESCGQPIETLEELEKRVGQPMVFLFKEYERWKELKEKGEKRDEQTD